MRIKLRRVDRAVPSRAVVTWLTLESQHGFLPRVVEGGLGRREITEFRFVNPPGIWFPSRGSNTFRDPGGKIYSRRLWRVTDVQVNAAIDESVFKPQIPIGTTIIDHTAGKTYRQGESAGQTNDNGIDWLAIPVLLLFIAAGLALCVRAWRRLR
ncbi:MAG: hypothetical protein ACE5KM_20870 [Planctomycetaceae bacterium]